MDRDWRQQVDSGVTALQILTDLCPSEPNHRIRLKDGKPNVAPQTYGVNFGTWLGDDPRMEAIGDGAMVVNGGLATIFTPNDQVLDRHAGGNWGIEFSSQQEGKSDQRATDAGMTSRSDQSRAVHVAWRDGSVRAISESINRSIWWRLGTQSGSEIITRF